jgi:NAD(P) transhydrogenase subunit alpha
MVPSTVKKLVKLGFAISVESTAGEASDYFDEDYRKCGARIVSAKDIWESSNIIVKVRQPIQNPELGQHEADVLKNT